jgi:hypothetical protein
MMYPKGCPFCGDTINNGEKFIIRFRDGTTLPEGVFKTIIVDTEIAPLLRHRGMKLTITHMVVYGPMIGTKFQKIHAYGHENPIANRLARNAIEAICRCVGIHPLQFNVESDHKELRGQSIIVQISNQNPVPAKPYPHTEPIGYRKWQPFEIQGRISGYLEQLSKRLKEE